MTILGKICLSSNRIFFSFVFLGCSVKFVMSCLPFPCFRGCNWNSLYVNFALQSGAFDLFLKVCINISVLFPGFGLLISSNFPCCG